jgi:hypothetical protein
VRPSFTPIQNRDNKSAMKNTCMNTLQ